MTLLKLIGQSLRYYWRPHLAIVLGVGIAVSALSGALIVGESVRTSLKELALSRLGKTEYIVTAAAPFTEKLAERIRSSSQFEENWRGAVPVLALDGIVIHEQNGRLASAVQVFGVDEQFWKFNEIEDIGGPENREAYLSQALARELMASNEDSLLLRVQKPSSIPAGVLQGRRNEPGRAVRLQVARVLTREQAGEFSPRAHQGEKRTIFVPLERLQLDTELLQRANMLLFEKKEATVNSIEELTALVEEQINLSDLGIRLRQVGQTEPSLVIESNTGYLSESFLEGVIAASHEIDIEPIPVLTYLATAISANGYRTPYSLVSALPNSTIQSAVKNAQPDEPGVDTPIWLSQWTADDLQAKAGDRVSLEYYLWSDEHGLQDANEGFRVAGIIPMTGIAIDPDLTPEYPGVSTSADIGDWDPPFPIDLSQVRSKDEDFWDDYRTAPKAFIQLDDGRSLWSSQWGQTTSVRLQDNNRSVEDIQHSYQKALSQHLPPALAQLRVIPVQEEALAASSGTTDFGEYFTYFSFFLVVSSLLLTMLFFRLGVEQRAHEIGLLSALGYTARTINGLLLGEGLVLAISGALLGLVGALGYSTLIMLALGTLWIDAVGTTELQVHASALSLIAGACGGIIAALVCIAWSLRTLRRSSARQLMSGGWLDPGQAIATPLRRMRVAAIMGTVLAGSLVGITALGWIPATAGFFSSGILLLVAGLCGLMIWLRRESSDPFTNRPWPLLQFGVRNVKYRPMRSVLSVALIASATFLIVSVGVFRRGVDNLDHIGGGSGGFSLIAETLVPLMYNPATEAGQLELGLGSAFEGIELARFRLRPGDDASCLNLYRPQNPRLLGATSDFIEDGRFSFSASLADTEAEYENPWHLLNQSFEDGAIPVIGDATSLSYVFHLSVGDDYIMPGPTGEPLRLRIVGALRDSVLQSELIVSEEHFVRLFPRHEGFRVFLIAAEQDQIDTVAAMFEDQLRDFGMDVQSTSKRLAAFHQVENTFLSTFQALGALGLILGTFGLGTVLLRNVLERQRELALLRATGYRRDHLATTVIAESLFLLACGLSLGLICALVAVAPAYAERDQAFPFAGTLALLVAVTISGLLSTILATRAATKTALLPALKNQ